MAFSCVHTATGLQLLASAEAMGTQIRLTHMAVGDGNGNATTPAETQTQLVRERFRATVNRVYQDPSNENMFTAELIIPSGASGFTLREVGIFDSNGNLFVVGNLPETYKPTADEGSYSDTVIRVPFMVSNASTVTLQIDPNIVIATQSWIINNINPALLLPGGTTGQILKKKSNADGDTEWGDLIVADIVVDVIEERQVLADSQTHILLSIVTTRGLALYIEGVRIPEGDGVDEWQPLTFDPDTTVILGKAYPAGTRVLLVQNEPTGAVPFPLIRNNNLSDVPDKGLGRSNLGVYSKAESDAAGQPGDIKMTARITAPTGWLKANGAAVSRKAYANLFAAIGTIYGAGDGFNTFNLPDLRGEFVRGWDDGRGIDSGRAFGSRQTDAIENIKGSLRAGGQFDRNTQFIDTLSASGAFDVVAGDKAYTGDTVGSGQAWGVDFDASRTVRTSTETRPRNVAMLYLIKT